MQISKIISKTVLLQDPISTKIFELIKQDLQHNWQTSIKLVI